MPSEIPSLARFAFVGAIVEWRGPAPFFFFAVPPNHVVEVHRAARLASYGWGVVEIMVTANGGFEPPFG